MKNLIKSLVVVVAVAAVTAQATLAAFTASASVTDSTFSTGTAQLQFKVFDEEGTPSLVDSVPGPTFTNILPDWTANYAVTLHNSGSVDMLTSVLGVPVSATSPLLKEQLEVLVSHWNDSNSNHLFDPGEVGATQDGWRTLAHWETNKLNLGALNDGQDYPLVFSFRTKALSEQGATVVYDFVFNGTTAGAIQTP